MILGMQKMQLLSNFLMAKQQGNVGVHNKRTPSLQGHINYDCGCDLHRLLGGEGQRGWPFKPPQLPLFWKDPSNPIPWEHFWKIARLLLCSEQGSSWFLASRWPHSPVYIPQSSGFQGFSQKSLYADQITMAKQRNDGGNEEMLNGGDFKEWKWGNKRVNKLSRHETRIPLLASQIECHSKRGIQTSST